MKNKFLIAFLFLFFSLTGYSQGFKEYNFKFNIKDKSEIEVLTKIISIDNVVNNTVYAFATDKNFEKFKSLNYKYTLLPKSQKSSNALMAATIAEMINWDKYPTYDVYVDMMNNYASSYPDICKVITIGSSVNGRLLLALKITDNVDIEEDEPEFFYSSTIHGDETAGMVLMLRLMDSLLTSYGSVSEITNLVDSVEIYINPLANPDGTYAGSNATIGNSSTRSNANGIDLNRNFPDAILGSHPDNEIWQPETEAMMNFANQHRFVLSGNFHGGTEVANYPWDHTTRRHPDDDWFIYVSRNYATSCQNNSPVGYFDDENNGITHGADWYKVYGGRQDYFTYFQNGREITFEISTTKLVASSSLPSYWNYNKDALISYIEESLHGFRGTVKDTDGNPLDAMIRIENNDTDLDSSMVFTDADIGDYHRLIEPETYTIIASAKGYYNDTVVNAIATENQSSIVNFVLILDSISSETTPEYINDTLNQGDSSQFYIVIKNNGLQEFEYTLNINYPDHSNSWVTLEKEEGVISLDQKDSIKVTINSKDLIQGNYISNISAIEEDGNHTIIPIKLTVNAVQSSYNTNPVLGNIKIFPNPFNDNITIEFFTQTITPVYTSIINTNGIIIFKKETKTLGNSKNEIHLKNFENLPSGLYFIQLRTNNIQITSRIVKQ